MKRFIYFCCLSLSLFLSGCTAILWNEDPAVHSYTEYEKATTDTVKAFGRTQQKNNERVVMMGEQYWYFIDANHSPELLKLLNTKLPKAFATSDNQPFKIKLNINAKNFYTDFTLYYQPKNENEKKILDELGFKLTSGNILYTKKYELSGEIYQANKNIRQDYQFETVLPIDIYVGKTSNKVDPIKLIGKIAMTPVTLAGDIVFIAVSWVLFPLTLK